MSLHVFTVVHVLITVVELVAGALVMLKLMQGELSGLTSTFLISAGLTSVTGFLFPFHGITPADKLGVITLLTTGVAAFALYCFDLLGGWRRTFVISVVITLYFDAFVAVVQSFEKVPALHALAPTGNELPFAIAQGVVLLMFLYFGFVSLKRFRL
ncbi:MAG: hypothetical protein V4555_02875 [Acidobacteriota bacterium]